MRLLVIDVGNTSTAVGLWSDGRVSKVCHIDDVERFEKFEKFERFERLDGVAYVSVVPKADRAHLKYFKSRGLKVHQISHRDFSNLSNVSNLSNLSNLRLDYPHPSTIGADRLADAAGAVSRYGAPVLVMDFGTALTAAVVTKDRIWRGGVIAPGFPLMRDYLFERTAKLPRMKIPAFANATAGRGRGIPKIGRSTEEAMRFGALVGYRGMVREIVAELRKNFKCDIRLVATGGFAKWVLRDIDLQFTIDPTLTLYGAGLICSKSF